MKRYILPVLLISVLGMSSCGDKGNSAAGDSTGHDPADSAKTVQVQSNDTNVLEDLLSLTSEKALIDKFGKGRIKYDTVWGAEGMFDMGSYLDKGTPNQVQFTWTDSLHRSGLGGISIAQTYKPDGSMVLASNWHSRTGIHLGSKAAEVQQVNGKQFKFSGVGWDYGGTVTDFEKGKLDGIGIGLTMDADYNVHSSETDYNNVSGDQDVMSDAPSVKAVGMQVVQIFVYNPPK